MNNIFSKQRQHFLQQQAISSVEMKHFITFFSCCCCIIQCNNNDNLFENIYRQRFFPHLHHPPLIYSNFKFTGQCHRKFFRAPNVHSAKKKTSLQVEPLLFAKIARSRTLWVTMGKIHMKNMEQNQHKLKQPQQQR